LGPSQHICGIVFPLFLPTFHHLPDEFELIVPVTDTIDSVDFHIHTIPGPDNYLTSPILRQRRMKSLMAAGEPQLAGPVPGSVAGRLALLGRVDSVDADSMLHLVGVEDRDRVAVGNINDGAFEDVQFFNSLSKAIFLTAQQID
jgi:hypothetical protein